MRARNKATAIKAEATAESGLQCTARLGNSWFAHSVILKCTSLCYKLHPICSRRPGCLLHASMVSCMEQFKAVDA